MTSTLKPAEDLPVGPGASASGRRRIAIVASNAEGVGRLLPLVGVLSARGHAVHIAVQDMTGVSALRLGPLISSQHGISIGFAVRRTDMWTRLAGRLIRARDILVRAGTADAPDEASADFEQDERARAWLSDHPRSAKLIETWAPSLIDALPPDPGVRTYLHQLDLDLLVLTESGPGRGQLDYATAARAEGVTTFTASGKPQPAELDGAAKAIESLAVEGRRPGPGTNLLLRAMAWLLLWADSLFGDRSAASRDPEAGQGGIRQQSLKGRLQERFASRTLPWIVGVVGRLLPESRILLREHWSEQLGPSSSGALLSAEVAMVEAAQSEGLVVFGPWLADPGREVLYWVPFVRWFRKRYQVDKQRVVVVSRGGAGGWYEGILGTYIDLGELFTDEALDELERQRDAEQSARRKRQGITDADRVIYRRIKQRLGYREFKIFHPWIMFVLFDRFWSGFAGRRFVSDHSRSLPLTANAKAVRKQFPDLPARYVAAAFAFNEQFPDTAENRRFAGEVITGLARGTEVVLIHPAMARPGDRFVPEGGRVHGVTPKPAQMVDIASAVIAGADAFVGVQGWMAYAAASMGKVAICLQSETTESLSADAGFAQQEFAAAGGRLLTVSTKDADLIGRILGREAKVQAQAGLGVAPAVS